MFNCGHDWQIRGLTRGRIERGGAGSREEARDNLWGMSGGKIAHIRTAWAECIHLHAVRPSAFRDSSVRSLALVDKEELTAVPKSLSAQ